MTSDRAKTSPAGSPEVRSVKLLIVALPALQIASCAPFLVGVFDRDRISIWFRLAFSAAALQMAAFAIYRLLRDAPRSRRRLRPLLELVFAAGLVLFAIFVR